MKLVIVDDDQALLNTLLRRLGQAGWQTTGFATAVSVESLIAAQADAYLLDLRFGELSGLNFVAPLRHALPKSRIIVLTGYASINTAVQAVKLGADDYLTKPVDFLVLKQALAGATLPEASSAAEALLSPEQLEWEHIQRVLAEYQGNISQTARSLGMHRRTLQRKLLKHRPH